MKNDYFIMAIDEKNNCPAGFYHAILAPEFDPKIKIKDYGSYPWYAGPKRYKGQVKVQNNHLTLMAERKYDYPVRRGSDYFYIIDENFKNCLTGLKHSFSQIIPVSTVDSKGNSWDAIQRFAAIPHKFFKSECMKEDSAEINLHPDWNYDLFDVKDIALSQATLFCSSKAKEVFEAANLKCIKYVDIMKMNDQTNSPLLDVFRPIELYNPV